MNTLEIKNSFFSELFKITAQCEIICKLCEQNFFPSNPFTNASIPPSLPLLLSEASQTWLQEERERGIKRKATGKKKKKNCVIFLSYPPQVTHALNRSARAVPLQLSYMRLEGELM